MAPAGTLYRLHTGVARLGQPPQDRQSSNSQRGSVRRWRQQWPYAVHKCDDQARKLIGALLNTLQQGQYSPRASKGPFYHAVLHCSAHFASQGCTESTACGARSWSTIGGTSCTVANWRSSRSKTVTGPEEHVSKSWTCMLCFCLVMCVPCLVLSTELPSSICLYFLGRRML
jgi:hypothetical protein